MTAPATPRIPSPADLARRPQPTPTAPQRTRAAATPRPLSAANAIAPGKLTTNEHFRKYYLLGLRKSGMRPNVRLVGHDLMWRASHATGKLSPSLQPSNEDLAAATGLTAEQVQVALQTLHTRGWLVYRRVQEGPHAGRMAYSLAIPAAALEAIRATPRSRAADGYAR